MEKTIPPHIIDVLKAARCDGHKLHLEGRLDRKVYADTMKFIELLGGKWTGKLGKGGHHAFDGDCADRIDDAVMTGKVMDTKKLFQFFETSKAVADRMVNKLSWRPGLTVLEPSAGRGRLIDAILNVASDEKVIWCCELDPKNSDRLQSEYAEDVAFQGADFMELSAHKMFDRIVMNPPFRGGQDVRHVRKAFDHLNAGGEMVAIMSPAFQYRTDKLHTEFREWLATTDHEVEDLDAGEFAESGTNIRTVMVVIRKS